MHIHSLLWKCGELYSKLFYLFLKIQIHVYSIRRTIKKNEKKEAMLGTQYTALFLASLFTCRCCLVFRTFVDDAVCGGGDRPLLGYFDAAVYW